MRIQRRKRSAFTLVELLVATALTLFLMAIISEAFGAASKTFNTMRTAGQLQERARQGTQIIRRDLAGEHFGGPFGPRSGPRVGDQRLDLPGWSPPKFGGYFEIRQWVPSTFEPFNVGGLTDGEGLPSTRAGTDNLGMGHILRFTVRLPDLPATELYSAELPTIVNTTMGPAALANHPKINAFRTGQAITYSRWAEVQYFLRPTGEGTPLTANGPSLPLFSLRRRVRLLASEEGITLPPMPNADAQILMARYPDVAMARIAAVPNTANVIVRVLGPEDVSYPNPTQVGDPIRMPYAAYSQRLNTVTGNMFETGDDILMTDVLSFEVKASWFNNQTTPSFEAIRAGVSPAVRPMFLPVAPGVTINADEPFDDIPIVLPVDPTNPNIGALNPTLVGQRRFDTWYSPPSYLPPQSDLSDFIDWDKPQGTIGGSLVGFLTQNNFQPPLRINVRAVQIKIRVWDSKAEKARQVTIVQEI